MSDRVPGSRAEDAWLTDEQLAQCTPADQIDGFQSPIPTQMVSNGEYMPVPQTPQQRRVEARIQELAEGASKKLGMSRRKFLASTGGMAAAFLAMNEVFGRFFNVSPIEMFEPAAYAASAAPADLFVFDDQTHLVRSSFNGGQLVGALRAIAQGPTTPGFSANPFNPLGQLDELGSPWTPWNPALIGAPLPPDVFDVIHYIESFFLQSQTTVAVVSNAPGSIFAPPGEAPRPPRNIAESEAGEILTAAQTAGVRDFVNSIAGSTRLLAHGILMPGVGNLEFMQFQIDNYHPDSWKGYNITNSAKVDFDPNSDMRMWRHDDEAVAYPTFELIMKNRNSQIRAHPGFCNICVHKGLAPGPPAIPERGFPTDLPKAAEDWPHLNFITYHSCIQPAFWDYQALAELESGRTREGVPDISWTTMYAQLVSRFHNCYAEVGTTFASSIVTFPTVWAHIIGQLLRYLGEDRIVFGTDSLWYGTPQWQIEAMWRFAIPDEIARMWRYPELTEKRKRKILGLNSARLYGLKPGSLVPGGNDGVLTQNEQFGPFYHPVPSNFEELIPDSLKTLLEFPGFASDNFSRMRQRYAEMGGERSNTRFGWIRNRA
jgi:hypothetical protein